MVSLVETRLIRSPLPSSVAPSHSNHKQSTPNPSLQTRHTDRYALCVTLFNMYRRLILGAYHLVIDGAYRCIVRA